MEIYSCNFCYNVLKTSSHLKRHQETAKYCLKMQEDRKNNKFICAGCEKEYTSNQNLKKHLLKCKSSSDKLLSEFQDIIDEKDNIIDQNANTVKEYEKTITELKAKLEIFEKDHEFIK